MRYTIGLDIGIASVGWAVINNDEDRIENLGVRVFNKAEDDKGKSPNFARRIARGSRRRLRRRAIRMQKIKELFIKYGLVNEKELEDLYKINENTIDVWDLREIALDNKIDRKSWARVLTHIAKRRGYKSNRKTDEKDNEVGKLKEGTSENKRIFEQNHYRTIGEMFVKDDKFKNNKRNKGGEYTNTVLRSMLVDEVHVLFKKQREFGSEFASEEFEKEYIDEMCYQEKYLTQELLEKMLGKCTLIPEEVRAPKNSYTFERFMLLQKVNNLKITMQGETIKLTEEQRKKIVEMAYNQSEVKYSQIRKLMQLDEKAKFADLSYRINKKNSETDDLTEEELNKKIENKKFVKLEGWHKIKKELKTTDKLDKFKLIEQDNNLQNIIADSLVRNKTDEDIEKYLTERNIDKDLIEAAKNINFTKFGHLSYLAMDKIIPGLEKGLTYDKACEEAKIDFKGKTREKQKKLPPILTLKENILNPVVLRSVSQTRKVINAIIDKYGSPMFINIETARDLSKSFDERKKIRKKQEENYSKNEEIKKYIQDSFPEIDFKPQNIVKVKLWREQQGMCAYSQKKIEASRLFEDNYVQIDHAIPFSRCFDDSYNNKVLVLTDENQNKKERTPYEYFGADTEHWHRYEEFVNLIYKHNIKKKERLLIKNFSDEKSKEWLSRNLNDTRYIAKYLQNYIKNNLQFAEGPAKNRVNNINGQATAVLRRYWGLDKDREASDKHHAQDAVVIACATPANIQRVSNYSRRRVLHKDSIVDKKTGEIIDLTIKEPWLGFSKEVRARMEDADNNGELYTLKHGKFYNYSDIDLDTIKPIFVSRIPERKTTGAAHKESVKSLKFEDKKFTTIKKSITSITDKEIKIVVENEKCKDLYISDRIMYDDLYQKLVVEKQKAEIIFKDGYRKNSKKGEGPIVRSVKVPSLVISGVKLKNKGIADNDNMVRVDIFEKNSKYYMVPIYVSDFTKKQLPNKAVVGKKDEDEWREMDESYTFKFSLYPNDLVKIKKKNEKEMLLYYNSADRSAGAINLFSPNERKKFRGIGIQSLEIFEKYNVDILGNISKIKKEKREGVN